MFPNDPNIIAVATDVRVESELPVLGLNDIPAIADFVKAHAENRDELLARATMG